MSTYDPLRRIIPSDQALANKALEAALKQVKGIGSVSTQDLARSLIAVENNTGLPDISTLPGPLPANVATFWTTDFVDSTGPGGTLRLADVIGTPSGWVHTANLTTVTQTLTSLTAAGAFDSLTNSINGVYTVMGNVLAGDYTDTVGDPGPPPTDLFFVEIPTGLPGAGTYGDYETADEAVAEAFATGLIPAMQSAVANIVAVWPTQVELANQAVANSAIQIIRENTNLAQTSVDFGNVVINLNPIGLVSGLAVWAQDITDGGAAQYFESIANTDSIGGQAVISTMRESRNQTLLQGIGVQTEVLLSNTVEVPLASLSTAQLDPDQAAAQKPT
jgi:hypothetical protein